MLKRLSHYPKMIIAGSCLFLLIGLLGCNRALIQAPPNYGLKIRYVVGQPLNFPDLSLEFIGQRKVDTSPEYPRGFTYYDFKVRQGNQEQLVSWSAGTGDIGPTFFEMAGQSYQLELAASDQLGRLAEDELVLWKLPGQVLALTTEPERQATVTAALQEIGQSSSRLPTGTPTSPSVPALPTSLPVKAELDQPFSLMVNQRGQLESIGLTIEFQTVLRDWRCPSRVNCSEAGNASLVIYAWLTGHEPTAFELNTNPPFEQDVPYDDYKIELLSLDPYPETPDQTIPLEDYRATFVVSLK
jgi:hypothetical protein